eukprot:SAG31_NODE_3888_length_3779_cov_1.505978_3_plen_200_part_00
MGQALARQWDRRQCCWLLCCTGPAKKLPREPEATNAMTPERNISKHLKNNKTSQIISELPPLGRRVGEEELRRGRTCWFTMQCRKLQLAPRRSASDHGAAHSCRAAADSHAATRTSLCHPGALHGTRARARGRRWTAVVEVVVVHPRVHHRWRQQATPTATKPKQRSCFRPMVSSILALPFFVLCVLLPDQSLLAGATV